jgi:hypothetical protein
VPETLEVPAFLGDRERVVEDLAGARITASRANAAKRD